MSNNTGKIIIIIIKLKDCGLLFKRERSRSESIFFKKSILLEQTLWFVFTVFLFFVLERSTFEKIF